MPALERLRSSGHLPDESILFTSSDGGHQLLSGSQVIASLDRSLLVHQAALVAIGSRQWELRRGPGRHLTALLADSDEVVVRYAPRLLPGGTLQPRAGIPISLRPPILGRWWYATR